MGALETVARAAQAQAIAKFSDGAQVASGSDEKVDGFLLFTENIQAQTVQRRADPVRDIFVARLSLNFREKTDRAEGQGILGNNLASAAQHNFEASSTHV